MSLHLLVRCDHDGCDAEAEVDDLDDFGTQPVISDALPGPDVLGHMVVDTGWISLPRGWVFAESGDAEPTCFRCPEHRP